MNHKAWLTCGYAYKNLFLFFTFAILFPLFILIAKYLRLNKRRTKFQTLGTFPLVVEVFPFLVSLLKIPDNQNNEACSEKITDKFAAKECAC